MNLKLRTLQDSLNDSEAEPYGSASDMETNDAIPKPSSPTKDVPKEPFQEPPKSDEPKDAVMSDTAVSPIDQVCET
jgi:hypothetical protein